METSVKRCIAALLEANPVYSVTAPFLPNGNQ